MRWPQPPRSQDCAGRISGLNHPRNRESLGSPAGLKIALDFDACETQNPAKQATDQHLDGYPQKVRKAPEGQVSPPDKSGSSPRQVR